MTTKPPSTDYFLASEKYLLDMQALGFTREEAAQVYVSLICENPAPMDNYKSVLKEILAAAVRQVCVL